MAKAKKQESIDELMNKSYSVVKSNSLTRQAKIGLTLQENKIMSFIISKIKPTDKPGEQYTISIADYCRLLDIGTKGNNYKEIKDSLRSLRKKDIWVTLDDGTMHLLSYIMTADIVPKSGSVKVRLDTEMEKYLIGLKRDFTEYELISVLGMKSNYSFMLYEFLKSYAFKNYVYVDIDTLKKRLSAEIYKNFADFRKRCLDVACNEITEQTELIVGYSTENKGKKVIAVNFAIRKKTARDWAEQRKKSRGKLEQMNVFDFLAEQQEK